MHELFTKKTIVLRRICFSAYFILQRSAFSIALPWLSLIMYGSLACGLTWKILVPVSVKAAFTISLLKRSMFILVHCCCFVPKIGNKVRTSPCRFRQHIANYTTSSPTFAIILCEYNIELLPAYTFRPSGNIIPPDQWSIEVNLI